MQQSNPSWEAERRDANPYAPPRSETDLASELKENEPAERQRNLPRLRESSIRFTGLLGLITAGCAALLFTLYVYDLVYHPEVFNKNGPPPLIAPPCFVPTSFFSLILLATCTSWGYTGYGTGGGGR
jgi:hypothetical protein